MTKQLNELYHQMYHDLILNRFAEMLLALMIIYFSVVLLLWIITWILQYQTESADHRETLHNIAAFCSILAILVVPIGMYTYVQVHNDHVVKATPQFQSQTTKSAVYRQNVANYHDLYTTRKWIYNANYVYSSNIKLKNQLKLNRLQLKIVQQKQHVKQIKRNMAKLNALNQHLELHLHYHNTRVLYPKFVKDSTTKGLLRTNRLSATTIKYSSVFDRKQQAQIKKQYLN